MNKLVASIEYTSLFLGIAITDVETVLSIIFLGISVLLGVVNLVLKLKVMLKDGKLDEKEVEELQKDVQELKDKVDKK